MQYLKNALWLSPFFAFFTGYFLLDKLFQAKALQMPNLIGMNLHDALGIISSNNLNCRITTMQDPLLTQDTVMHQLPAPDQKIKENQTVFLNVSIQSKKKIAPLCIHKHKNDIEKALEAEQIKFKIYELESTYPKGICFAQHPNSDQEIAHKMIIYISSGYARPMIMPNLKGNTIGQTEERLALYSVKTEIFYANSEPGSSQNKQTLVQDQRPLAGSIVKFDAQKPLHVQLKV